MAKCPNCDTNLPIFKVLFLSRINNQLRCKACNKIIEADKSFLGIIGAIGGGASSFFIIWNKEVFRNNPHSLFFGFICSVIIIILVGFVHLKKVRLIISKEQDVVLEEDIIIKEEPKKPPLPKNATNIDYLKHKYYNLSDKELEDISCDLIMTEDAHKASKELLEERKKVT